MPEPTNFTTRPASRIRVRVGSPSARGRRTTIGIESLKRIDPTAIADPVSGPTGPNAPAPRRRTKAMKAMPTMG